MIAETSLGISRWMSNIADCGTERSCYPFHCTKTITPCTCGNHHFLRGVLQHHELPPGHPTGNLTQKMSASSITSTFATSVSIYIAIAIKLSTLIPSIAPDTTSFPLELFGLSTFACLFVLQFDFLPQCVPHTEQSRISQHRRLKASRQSKL